MADGNSLNIALLPDEDTIGAAIAVSEAVSAEVGTEFTLAHDELIPHVTLYQTAFPAERTPQVCDAVAEVAAHTAAFRVRLRDVEVYKWTFLFWQCELSPELRFVQQQIVAATNDLRQGLVLPMLSAARPFLDSTELSDVDAYGAIWIGPNYLPHITLSRIKDVQHVSKALTISKPAASGAFVPRAIVVGESREHGTIGQILQRYDL